MKACERKSYQITEELSEIKKLDLIQLSKILDKQKDHSGALIPVLQEAQKIYGYLSAEILERIAITLGVPLSQVYGVVTFYSQFRMQPHGQNIIRVCRGTACHVSGANEITSSLETQLGIERGGTTKDGKFTLEAVACLGCCSLAPVMMINDETYGRLTSQKALKTVRKIKRESQKGDKS